MRIAGAAPGSGTRVVAKAMLSGQGPETTSALLPLGGTKAVDALESGDADVALMVSVPEAEALPRLLRASARGAVEHAARQCLRAPLPGVDAAGVPRRWWDLQCDRPAQLRRLANIESRINRTRNWCASGCWAKR